MTYLLAHLDDAPDVPWEESNPHEEIYVNPFGSKVMIAVPIGAVRHLLPILHKVTTEQPPATCPSCAAELPAPWSGDP
jgi:hypothetical protein